jgi:hypothetical protein
VQNCGKRCGFALSWRFTNEDYIYYSVACAAT